MALEQVVLSAPPTSTSIQHPRDVKNVLESLPTREEESNPTQALLDAIAKHHTDEIIDNESVVFRGALTAMMWIGGAFIGVALAVTMGSILR